MRTIGPTAQAILGLELLEGGAIPFELIVRELEKRGSRPEKTALFHVLQRLIRKGEIVRVKTNDGGALYARPATLFPGRASVLANTPALRIRHRKGISARALALRETTKNRRWQDEEVRRGAHDHRNLDRPCSRCYDWPPPFTGGFPGLAWSLEARKPISGFCQA